MIFLGDVAVPREVKPKIDYLPDCFFSQKVIANLEGIIASQGTVNIIENKLFSDEDVLSFLNSCNVKVVTLANNHVFDVDNALGNTVKRLANEGISCIGAGRNLFEAREPAVFTERNKEYVLVAFGWKAISCIYATESSMGINPLEQYNVKTVIENIKKVYPNKKIIASMHWDYELERFPMPAHRKFAKYLIDLGVEMIVGHHPHCVQGAEFYNGKWIIYSLGNWFIPGNVYMNGKVKFPEYTFDEIAVEFNDEIVVHSFRYVLEENKLEYKASEKIQDCELIKSLSVFAGMNDKEYEKWFKSNRYKKKMLPIFYSVDDSMENRMKYIWISKRQRIVNMLFDLGIRKRSGMK